MADMKRCGVSELQLKRGTEVAFPIEKKMEA